jgi:hypothetical protein
MRKWGSRRKITFDLNLRDPEEADAAESANSLSYQTTPSSRGPMNARTLLVVIMGLAAVIERYGLASDIELDFRRSGDRRIAVRVR